MAVPPFAVMPRSVTLAMVPPSTPTEPPQVSPTPMALPAFPPLLTLPMETAPPLAEAVATPPLPAEAMSVQLSPSPKNLSRRLCIVLPLYSSMVDIRCASSLVAILASQLTGSRTGPSRYGAHFMVAVSSYEPIIAPLPRLSSHQYLLHVPCQKRVHLMC